MKHVVMGAGQIGTAIAEVLGDATLHDIGATPEPCDVLHICFGWSPDFERYVRRYVGDYTPELVIIHSTVPVGTSRRLGAVHSPVTGKHPHLAESIRTFLKWFGGSDAAFAAQVFEAVGVDVAVVPDPETTEAGKLWQTLQFGLLVAMEKECRRFCEAVGANPTIAYEAFNRTYSMGYEDMGEPYTLPVLRHMDGPIGGHCVIPNARMTDTPLARTLVELNETW
jgi:3-hydroxyisobutyrate dehydrogenase-like beta-hydroxyacid dehydrogenase